MKELYIVAQNAFTVSADDTLEAWRRICCRFSPFAVLDVDSTNRDVVLEIDIKSCPLPECEGELVYETEYDGIGFISARALRHDDRLIIEFWHILESEPRIRLIMSSGFDRAEILIRPDGDRNDTDFLTHALMIAFMIATAHNGTLVIHASSVIYRGKAYLFQGRSGTGKSTHASLWIKNIEGVELLNDDNPVIRFTPDGVAMAYGSPWSGKTHCYRNVAAPIGALVRIVRAESNSLRPLASLHAYASLVPSVAFVPFVSDHLREVRHRTIERLAMTVPCCEMHCRPDADAAFTCMHGLTGDADNNNNQ